MIRLATHADLDIIKKEEEKYFGYYLSEEIINDDLKTSFILEEHEVISYIELWHDGKNGQIEMFFVNEEFRGKHYGLQLLEHALDYLKNKGICTITLEVKKTNDKAIDLYEKNGFKKYLEKKNYYKDGNDAIFMIKGELI